jgi:tetratricopeptide (TPR) repeat protein
LTLVYPDVMQATVTKTRRRVVVDQRALAQAIGTRIRAARLRAGLTQQQLAGDRYTKAYISALELGHAKPSMAALDYLAPRLGTSSDRILADPSRTWSRLEADVALASGHLDDARVAYEGLLDVTVEPGHVAELELGLAETLCRLGRPGEAIKPAEDARRRFADSARAIESDRALYWLASAHQQMGDLAEGRRILRELLERTDPATDPDMAVRVRIGLAMVESTVGDPQIALAYLEEAREASNALDLRRRGTFFFALAKGRAKVGDLEGAIRSGMEALQICRLAEAGREQARVEAQLATIYLQLGDRTRARGLLADARAILKRAEESFLLADITDSEARIALDEGDAASALQLATEARRQGEAAGNSKAVFDSLMTAGRALEALERRAEAIGVYEEASTVLGTDPGSVVQRREVYGAWADALAADGKHAEAYAIAKRALG